MDKVIYVCKMCGRAMQTNAKPQFCYFDRMDSIENISDEDASKMALFLFPTKAVSLMYPDGIELRIEFPGDFNYDPFTGDSVGDKLGGFTLPELQATIMRDVRGVLLDATVKATIFTNIMEAIMKATPDDFSYPSINTEGSYQSWNSGREELARIGAFLKIVKPHVVVECGTFEGYGTEFMSNVMIQSYEGDKRLITIDTSSIVNWENGEYSPIEKEEFNHVLQARSDRMNNLKKLSAVEVIYIDSLIHLVGETIAKTNVIDFIYHDATHLAAAMAKDIDTFISGGLNVGTWVCFDDVVPGHPFPELFREQYAKEWIGTHIERGRGQFWMMKVK